jgi:hypothetical protein
MQAEWLVLRPDTRPCYTLGEKVAISRYLLCGVSIEISKLHGIYCTHKDGFCSPFFEGRYALQLRDFEIKVAYFGYKMLYDTLLRTFPLFIFNSNIVTVLRTRNIGLFSLQSPGSHHIE